MSQPFGSNHVENELDRLDEIYFPGAGHLTLCVQPHVNLIIGRRGSGKSALGHFLGRGRSSNDPSVRKFDVYVDINEPQVFASVLTQLASSLGDGCGGFLQEDVARLWSISFWHALLGQVSRLPAFNRHEGAATVTTYLKMRNVYERLGTPALTATISIILASLGAKAKEVGGLSKALMQWCNDKHFASALKTVREWFGLTKNRGVIVLDTLEQYPIHDPVMRACLSALMHSITELRNQLGLLSLPSEVQLKCFLPAEIFATLEEQTVLNLGKTYGGVQHLHWNSRDLLRTLCWRLLTTVEGNPAYRQDCPPGLPTRATFDWTRHAEVRSAVWDRFFPLEKILVRGVPLSSFDYLSRLTQLRPRQMIWMCNSVAVRSLTDSRGLVFSTADVRAGAAAVSGSLAKDVLTSFESVYPNIVRIVHAALNGCGEYLNDRDIERAATRSKAHWAGDYENRQNLKRLLVESGVIGRVEEEGLTEGSDIRIVRTSFEYAVPEKLRSSDGDLFAIHPMFHRLLGVQSGQFGLDPLRRGHSHQPIAGLQLPLGPEDLLLLGE